MSAIKYSLSDFLKGCGGTWQRAIHISCRECERQCPFRERGFLLSAALDGAPIVIAVEHFEKLTGNKVEPKQCAAMLEHNAFDSAHTRYLLWELESDGECSLRKLDEKVQKNDISTKSKET